MRRRKFLSLASGAVLAGAGCLVNAQPAVRRVALVLGGGGCRGFGHIGVIRAFEKNGLRPDLIVGSSAGSLVGALYAAGLSANDIERLGSRVDANMLRDWIFPKLGLFGGSRIRKFINEHAGVRTIESLPVRFAAVATDLRTGAIVILDRGELGLAVQASSSAPGLLEPVRLGSQLLVDGNLVAPVPVDAARRLGASHVIAVDVSFPPDQATLADAFDALYQGFSILTRRIAIEERDRADISLQPHLPEHNTMAPMTVKALIVAGERSANEAMPKLREVFRNA